MSDLNSSKDDLATQEMLEMMGDLPEEHAATPDELDEFEGIDFDDLDALIGSIEDSNANIHAEMDTEIAATSSPSSKEPSGENEMNLEDKNPEEMDLEDLDLESLGDLGDIEAMMAQMDAAEAAEDTELADGALGNQASKDVDFNEMDLDDFDLENMDLNDVDLEELEDASIDPLEPKTSNLTHIEENDDVQDMNDTPQNNPESVDAAEIDIDDLDLEALDPGEFDLENIDLDDFEGSEAIEKTQNSEQVATTENPIAEEDFDSVVKEASETEESTLLDNASSEEAALDDALEHPSTDSAMESTLEDVAAPESTVDNINSDAQSDHSMVERARQSVVAMEEAIGIDREIQEIANQVKSTAQEATSLALATSQKAHESAEKIQRAIEATFLATERAFEAAKKAGYNIDLNALEAPQSSAEMTDRLSEIQANNTRLKAINETLKARISELVSSTPS